MIFRFAAALVPVLFIGCNHMSPLAGPQELGLVERFPTQDLPVTLTSANDLSEMRIERNDILSKWVLRSDYLCSQYQLQLSRTIRDSRLATDFVATVLSGLATIFIPVQTVRPLAGSAAIVLGVGGDIQSDLFLQQAGDLVANAIQAIRSTARKDLQQNWLYPYDQYTLLQGLLDVERYDRETCTIDRAMNAIRTSLGIAGPTVLALNNPIVGVPQPVSAITAPVTTTITTTQGSTRTTPQGTIVTSPTVQMFTTPAQSSPVPTAPAPAPFISRPRCNPPETAAILTGKGQLKALVAQMGSAGNLDRLNSIAEALPGAGTPARSAVVKANAIIVFIDRRVCTQADLDRARQAVTG